MEIAEKERGLSVFGTDILNTFLPTTEITAQLTGKIGTNLPVTEGLRQCLSLKQVYSFQTGASNAIHLGKMCTCFSTVQNICVVPYTSGINQRHFTKACSELQCIYVVYDA